MSTILILEDDMKLLRLYTKATENAGHTVISVSSLKGALTAMNYRMVDLCISDIRLDDAEPDVVLKRMARAQKRQNIPVIMISAHMDLYLHKCHDLGLERTLQKPFSHRDLTAMIVEILGEDSDDT